MLFLFSPQIMSDFLQPQALQHARLSSPSPSPEFLPKFMFTESVKFDIWNSIYTCRKEEDIAVSYFLKKAGSTVE